MNKYTITALILTISAFSLSLQAATKKDKKDKKKTVPTTILLQNQKDSISYAAGKFATRGLKEYLVRQCQVDTAYMQDFVKGMQEALEKQDPAFKAYIEGARTAEMINKAVRPSINKAFEGTAYSIDSTLFTRAFCDALLHRNEVMNDSDAIKYYTQNQKAQEEAKSKAYIEANKKWLENNAKQPDVKTAANGLQYKIIRQGNGNVPTEKDRVTVKYEGKLIDGTIFDSSYKRDPQTTTFGCGEVIKGWTQILTMMPVGSKWEVYIPQELAYGARTAGQIKPYSTLIFTIELVAIEDACPETTDQPTAHKMTPKKTGKTIKKTRKHK